MGAVSSDTLPLFCGLTLPRGPGQWLFFLGEQRLPWIPSWWPGHMGIFPAQFHLHPRRETEVAGSGSNSSSRRDLPLLHTVPGCATHRPHPSRSFKPLESAVNLTTSADRVCDRKDGSPLVRMRRRQMAAPNGLTQGPLLPSG